MSSYSDLLNLLRLLKAICIPPAAAALCSLRGGPRI